MANIEDNKMFEIINKNSTHVRIANYILEYFPGAFEFQQAKKVAEYFINEKNYLDEDIINGIYDSEILKFAKHYKMQKESVLQDGEIKKEVPLKTNIKVIGVKVIAGIVAFTILVGGVIYIVKNTKNAIQELNISEDIGVLTSEITSDDFKYERDIAKQNQYRVGYDYDRHEDVYAYHTNKMADDVINVCVEHPELFDVVIQNLYANLKYNKLEIMDEVINCLKNYTKNDESLNIIYNQVKDCDIFLDYIIQKGFLSPNNPDYEKILMAIENYKNITSGVPYTSISEEDQKAIDALLDEFKQHKKIQYDKFESEISELADSRREEAEEQGFGGR